MRRKELSDSAGSLFIADTAGQSIPHHTGHRERLRERFFRNGAEQLADYEVLELLLFGVIPRQDTKPIAKALLAKFGSFGEVLAAHPNELKGVAGIKDGAATLLKAVQASIQLALQTKVRAAHVISSWSDLIDYCTARMAYETVEQFRVIYLDRKNKLIADEAQQKGTVDHTPVYPREVVKRALALEASALIMVHNHPSGDPTPSRADIEMTRKVKDAAAAVGITLHDHVVVSRGGHVSFRTQGLI
ncbi:MAG: RadC family protein [Candidatus Binataceae bacterium]